MKRANKYLAALVLFLLSLFLYLYKLGEIPSGFHGDEAWISLHSLKIAKEHIYKITGVGDAYHPTVSFLPQAASFTILGKSIFSARLPSALFSALSAPVFYLLTTYLFGAQVAIISSILFATSHLWLAMSRLAINNSQIVFFELLAFYFLFKSLNTKRKLYFALLGISCSMMFYLYAGFRAIPLIIIFIILKELIFNKQRKILLKRIFITLFFFLVFSSPQLIFFAKNPHTFIDRAKSIFVFGQSGEAIEWRDNYVPPKKYSQIFLEQFGKTFLFFAGSDTSGQYGHPGPLLDPVSSFLMLLGILIAIRNLKNKKYLFLLLWFSLVLITGNLFMIGAFFLPRATGMLPVIYIFIALGLQSLLKLSKKLPKNLNKLILTTSALMIISLISINLNTYFVESEKEMFGDLNKYRAVMIANRLNSLDSSYLAIFLTVPQITPNYFPIKFLSPNVNYKNIENPKEYIPNGVSKTLFIIDPVYKDNLEEIKKLNPKGSLSGEFDAKGKPLIFFYQID